MSVRVVNYQDEIVSVANMEDGDIAIIVSWAHPSYVNYVVQRYLNNLISIGRSSGSSWTDFFNSRAKYDIENKVRILKLGTLLEIV